MALEFGTMSKRGQWGIIGVLCVAMIGAYYYYVYTPYADEASRLETEIGNIQLEIQRTRQIAAQLPALEAELALLEGRLEILKSILPESQDRDLVLRSFDGVATDTGMEIRRMAFQEPVLHDFYGEIPLDLEVAGTYHNLALFFDRIGKLGRIVTVGQLQVETLRGQSPHTVEASFTASTFFFLPETQAPPGEAAPSGGPTAAGR